MSDGRERRPEFSGKVAIVTGGAMGSAQRSPAAGRARRQGRRSSTATRSRGGTGRAARRARVRGAAIAADVSIGAEVGRCVADIVDPGPASTSSPQCRHPALWHGRDDHREAEWDEVIDVNLKSVYLVCHVAIPHLKKTRGAIVDMASVQSFATQRASPPTPPASTG